MSPQAFHVLHLQCENDGGGADEGSDATGTSLGGLGRAALLRVTDDTTGEGTTGVDDTAEEGRSAGGVDRLVERGLAGKEDGAVEAGRVRNIGFEGDVGGEDRARARSAQRVGGEAGRDEEEGGVRALERAVAGEDLLAAGRVQRVGRGGAAGDLGRAVAAAVVLGAGCGEEGVEDVKRVVDGDHVLVLRVHELILACRVEAREGAPDVGLGAGGGGGA